LPAGAPLPSELELCELFGTSRTAVREAVRQLETLGLVESRQGARRTVRERDELWALPLVQDLLVPRGELDLALVPHLLELHRDFLLSVYERAGQRGTPAHWARLRELMRQQAAEQDVEAFVRRDLQMWLLLAEAAANPLYGLLMRGFAASLEQLVPLIAALVPAVMLEQPLHGPMLEALESGRAHELRDELCRVLEASDAAFLENLRTRWGGWGDDA
jgi:DNA-binding FadR family transcriptional regulator